MEAEVESRLKWRLDRGDEPAWECIQATGLIDDAEIVGPNGDEFGPHRSSVLDVQIAFPFNGVNLSRCRPTDTREVFAPGEPRNRKRTGISEDFVSGADRRHASVGQYGEHSAEAESLIAVVRDEDRYALITLQ